MRSLTNSDGRRERGKRTHQEILSTAVDLGSREGLEALTIGRLAATAGVSKSGLFAHFGSKQELQLATIDSARAIFMDEVIAPALPAAEGLPRLRATLAALGRQVGVRVYYPRPALCTDNGAMIAYAGWCRHTLAANDWPPRIIARPRWPLAELGPVEPT